MAIAHIFNSSHKAIGVPAKILLLLYVLLAFSMPASAYVASSNLRDLEEKLRKENSPEERCKIYLNILDEVYSDALESDKYRERFINEAEKLGKPTYITQACREICDSYNYNLVKRAYHTALKLPKTERTQAIATLLHCHMFWAEADSMPETQKEMLLASVRQEINNKKKWENPLDEYYANFQVFALHKQDNNDELIEPYTNRMYEITKGLKKAPFLSRHALVLISDMLVRTSQFALAKEHNAALFEMYKEQQTRLESRGRHRDLDISAYRAAMRLLISKYEMEHKVDSALIQKILKFKKEHSIQQNSVDCTLDMLPIYTALYENKLDDALAMLKKKEEKEGFTYDFEYDTAVTIYWLTGNPQKAIELTNHQIATYKKVGSQIDQRYLKELGLNTEWLDVNRQNYMLELEKKASEFYTQENRSTLNELLQQHYNDSVNYALAKMEKEKRYKVEQNKNEASSQKARDEKQNIAYNVKIFAMCFVLLTIIMLVILVPYMIRLRKMNKRLTQEHQRLRITTDKANQSNKLKVFFLQNTSHDIRNPLGAIANMSQMLQDMVTDSKDEDMVECAKIVKENTNLLSQMMNTILDISAIESGRHPIVWEECYPMAIVQESATAISFRKDKPINIIIESNIPDNYQITSDSRRIRQLTNSLLNNAWKFTDQGTITVRLSESNNNFIMEVEDTGRGIPKEKADQIFQRFYKMNEFTPGTGLGLSLCKVISEKLMGSLVVDTNYAKGARFVFTQPLNKEKSSSNTKWVGMWIGLLLSFASLTPLNAQNPHKAVYDSLSHEIDKAHIIDQKVMQIKNLMDYSRSYFLDSLDHISEKLYDLGKKTGSHEIMIEAARNAFTPAKAQEMLSRISTFPKTEEKLMATTFLRLYILTHQLYSSPIEKKREWISNAIVNLQSKQITNPYERFYMLYGLCYASMGIEQSEMLATYLDELVEMAPHFRKRFRYLSNMAYQTGYICYLSLNNKQKAAATIGNLLKSLSEQEEEYHKIGRTYRQFDQFRLRYLTDLYFCESALTDLQKEECYKNITRIITHKPNMLNQVSSHHKAKIQMIMAIHENRWEDAAQYANHFADMLDMILYQNSTVLLGEELSVPHLEMMTNVYQHTNNLSQMLKTRILLCELYRRTITNMKHYNYQHFGIRLKIMDAKIKNAEMQIEKERKDAEDRKLHEEIERNRLINEHEKHLNQMEEFRLDSLTRDSKLHSEQMDSQAEKSQHTSNMLRRATMFVAVLLIAITLIAALYITSRLQRRQRRLRKLKVRLSNELRRAQKSDEETTAFLKSIRHEVATPLNAIMGMTKQMTMMAEEKDSEEMKLLSDVINENGEQLLSLINDILNLSLIQSGEYNLVKQWHDVRSLCDTQIQSVAHRCQPGVQLKAEYDIPEDAQIQTDAVRFRQVITNLFTNACKYTSTGSIKLQVTQNDEKEYRFTVTDTGSGIKAEDAERVFERFEKLGSQKPGTGLGLNISRTIANKLGGTLYLDTTYTEGAKFVFTHPATDM